MNTPVRLGVSPAAASTPMGVFNQRLEALFPCTGALGCRVCFTPPLFFLVYLCMNVGPQGLLAVALPALFLPKSTMSLGPATLPSPVHPGCPSLPISAPPTGLDVSSLSPWLSDFPVVRFSVSSGCFLFLNCCCPSFGCARRRSVSTYASILVSSIDHVIFIFGLFMLSITFIDL